MSEEKLCSHCGGSGLLDCGGCGEVFYCSRDHQRQDWINHKPFCRSYKITSEPGAGNFLVASRKMNAGYLIFSDEPLFEAPLSISAPVCLGCHILLNDKDMYICPECAWPMCSEACTESLIHKRECKFLSRDDKKIGVPQNFNETPRYDLISLLRGLLLSYHNDSGWKCMLSMESHSAYRENSKDPYHMASVRYMSEVLKMDFEPEVYHHVRGSIITNGMEIRSPNGSKIRALYPRVRLLNHSCTPNVHLSCSPAGIMEVRSSVPIEKGEILYITYTGTDSPRWDRQQSTNQIYNFDCICDRCKDPTELGTYFSSPVCPDCPGKYLLPKTHRLKSRWQCICCELEYTLLDVQQDTEEWLSRLQMEDFFGEGTVKNVTAVINSVENYFHSKHFIYLKIAHRAIGILLKDESFESLNLRKFLWKRILDVYNVLEPGMTRRRGMTLYELGTTILKYTKLGIKEKQITETSQQQHNEKAFIYLQEAIDIFRIEPKGTPESYLFGKISEILRHGGIRIPTGQPENKLCIVCNKIGAKSCGGCGEIFYCGKDHQRSHWTQHKSSCRTFTLQTSNKYGCYMKTARMLKAGEFILEEEPLIQGPTSISELVCISCHSAIETKQFVPCQKCNWPLCSTNCINDKSYHTKEECLILSKDTKSIGVPNQPGETERYDVILVIRALLLLYKDYFSWKKILSMESHWKKRKENNDPYHLSTVKYLTEVCKIDFDEDVVSQIRGILITNSYDIKSSSNFDIRGLYCSLSKLNHSCIPNTFMSANSQGKIVLRASFDIPAGIPLYTNYIDTTEPVSLRLKYLRSVYFFDCECIRCTDPKELDTYFSNPKCELCSKYMLSKIKEGIINWSCSACEMCLSGSEADEIMDDVVEHFTKWDENNTNIDTITSMLDAIEKEYHEHHYLWMKCAVVSLDIIKNIQEEQSYNLQIKIWDRMLNLFKIIEPGNLTKIGRILFHSTTTKLILTKTSYHNSKLTKFEYDENLTKIEESLKEVETMLQYETPDSLDYSVLLDTKQKLKEINAMYDEL